MTAVLGAGVVVGAACVGAACVGAACVGAACVACASAGIVFFAITNWLGEVRSFDSDGVEGVWGWGGEEWSGVALAGAMRGGEGAFEVTGGA